MPRFDEILKAHVNEKKMIKKVHSPLKVLRNSGNGEYRNTAYIIYGVQNSKLKPY